MGAILETEDCVERRIGYAISYTPPTGINPVTHTPQNEIIAAKCNINAKCNNIDAEFNKIFNAECNNLPMQIVITFLTHNVRKT